MRKYRVLPAGEANADCGRVSRGELPELFEPAGDDVQLAPLIPGRGFHQVAVSAVWGHVVGMPVGVCSCARLVGLKIAK